jgi:hypothetical protein
MYLILLFLTFVFLCLYQLLIFSNIIEGITTTTSIPVSANFSRLSAAQQAVFNVEQKNIINTFNPSQTSVLLGLSVPDLTTIANLTEEQVIASYLLGGAGSATTLNVQQLLTNLQTLYNNNITCQENNSKCKTDLISITAQNDSCNLDNSYLQLNKSTCDNFIMNQSKLFSPGATTPII